MAPRGYLHACLIANLTGAIHRRLLGTSWHPLGSGMQIKVVAAELITYADLSIFHDAPSLERHPHADVLTPSVNFEVFADATEAYDRGQKSSLYRQIPSLRAYVLVAQDQELVEVRTWKTGSIFNREYRGLGQTVEIPAVGVSLPLAEVYRDVEFASRQHALM